MNKLKAAAKGLRSHLARDTTGCQLLDDVLRVTNDQRVELATCNTKLDDEKSVNNTLRGKLQSATEKNDQLKSEQERQNAIAIQHVRTINGLEETVAKLQSQVDDFYSQVDEDAGLNINAETEDVNEVIRMMKALRHDMRFAPLPEKRASTADAVYVYNIRDIVKNLSGNDMMILGRFVAALALMNLPCTFIAYPTAIDSRRGKVKDKMLKPFVQWINKRLIQNDPEGEERYLRTQQNAN